MRLIGQTDSPFVRRVAVTLLTYGVAFDHDDWSGVGDAARIAPFSPLLRVPVLVDDDGAVLTDSAAIVEVIDHRVGRPRAVLDRPWPVRRDLLRLIALAAGVADKGASLVFEGAFGATPQPDWTARREGQVTATLAVLDAERAAAGAWLLGDAPSHADVMLGTMWRFIAEALPGRFDLTAFPALARHGAACEALPAFAATYRPYKLEA